MVWINVMKVFCLFFVDSGTAVGKAYQDIHKQ